MRHACRLFVTAAHLQVPVFCVVVRKGYGLGAQAMAVGGFDAPLFTVAWPTGEFGGMGLEGAVKLGYRKELEAVPAGPEREALYQTAGGAPICQRLGHQHGHHAGDRRGDRPRRDPRLAGARARQQRPGRGTGSGLAPARFVDVW